MTVQALWAGDQTHEERRVTPSDLAELSRTNRLGNRVRYVLE